MPPTIQTVSLSPSQTKILLRCFTYLRPHWKLTVGAYLMMLLIDSVNMINPLLIGWTIDRAIPQLANTGSSRGLLLAAVGLLVMVLIKGFFTYFQGVWTEVASQNVAYDMRNELQRKITQLSFSFHDQSEAGDLLSRAIQDVERIRFLTGRATLRVIEGVVLISITAIILFWMNPKLALLAVIVMPLLTVQSIRFGRVFRPLSSQIQKQLGVVTTRVEQNLRGARVVKTFAQEEAEIGRFDVENERWFELSAFSARLQAVNMPLLQLIANLATVGILWFGGLQVIESHMTLGELVAFTTYMGQLLGPVRFLGMVLPAIAMAGASAERIFEILDTIPAVHEDPDAAELIATEGRVRFENISFAYGKHSGILKGISFEAEPKQVVALVGPTGSGKSTVINLIPRFYDPSEGRITIDGQDIYGVTLNSLRSQIGMVLQETTLFAASIRENITFGKPDATQEQIEAAAKDAQAHEFILHTAHGYDTEVGEKGITLSGGQKQRIAIARAILTSPRILILDDATSSVDSETEHLIQMALDRVMENRTTFVIAHRLSTVQRADLILVLEKGRVVARGKHEELLKSSGLYRSVYEQQIKKEKPGD
jgi:ATP-binding cassette subfamily B protein